MNFYEYLVSRVKHATGCAYTMEKEADRDWVMQVLRREISASYDMRMLSRKEYWSLHELIEDEMNGVVIDE